VGRVFNSGTENKSICFHPLCDNKFFSGDITGEIFEWDIGAGRCISRHVVDGALGIQTMTSTVNNRLLFGSRSGFVTMVNIDDVVNPVKHFDNLTSSVSTVVAHPDAPIALACSQSDHDSIRMIHLEANGFVYQNFPGANSKLGRVTAVAFGSSKTGSMAVGNEHGHVKLWKMTDLASSVDPRHFI